MAALTELQIKHLKPTGKVYRVTERKLPEFVLKYFDRCAQRLLANVAAIPLENTISKKAPRANEYSGEDCLKALGLYRKNQLNPFAAMRRYFSKYYLMFDIEREKKENLARGEDSTKARMNAIRTIHAKQDRAFRDKPIGFDVLYKYYSEHKKNTYSSED